jgi:uncharacterized protein YcbK (DUF882 family)
MMWSRRRLIKVSGLAIAATAGFALAPRARALAPESKRIAFLNLHTNENLELDFFIDGAYSPPALAQIDRLLRDYRTGEVHVIDPSLLDYLYDVASLLGADPSFQVISGYRSPATNAILRNHSDGVARGSLHMQGQAIDIRMAGINCENLATRALETYCGGVGYYATADFVHLDTGAFRTWSG